MSASIRAVSAAICAFRIDPMLLGDDEQERKEGKRGPEKRRTLLVYLEEHREELRPYRTDGET